MPSSITTVANEQVAIAMVCELIGMSLPEIPDGKSVKVRCPFGTVFHRDQGVETAFRVYPGTNSAYCFACSEYFSPVSLAAKAWNLSYEDAAIELLDRIGYKPLTLAQAWENVTARVVPPDTTMLGEALKTYCSRQDATWKDRQFDPHISGVLDRCLDLLSLVHTDEDARAWLETTKSVMVKALGSK